MQVHDNNVSFLADSGAFVSVITIHLVKKILSKQNVKLDKPSLKSVIGVHGDSSDILGSITLPLQFNNVTIDHTFQVLNNLHFSAILGVDFLQKHNATLDFDNNVLTLPSKDTSVPIRCIFPPVGLARTLEKVIIDPQSEIFIPVHISRIPKDTHIVALLEPSNDLLTKHHVLGSKSLVTIRQGRVMYRILNPLDSPITLWPKTIVALAHHVDQNIEPVSLGNIDDDKVNATTSINACSPDDKHSDEHYIEIAKGMGFDLAKTNLTSSQRRQMQILIGKYRKAFAMNLSELGCTDVYEHHIDTGDSPPVSQAFYRTTPEKMKVIENNTNELLQHDIIEPSVSPYQSPVVAIPKRQSPGEWRVAVDMRKLNKVCKPMSFPLPTLETVFDCIAQGKPKYFSTLDLRSGFYQIKLTEESKHKTAFVTHQGQYQFKRMPFGLKTAPIAYQMVMQHIFRNINWKYLIIYVDDLIIYSDTFNNHISHLSQVMSKLVEAKLTLKPSKCMFGVESVKYLGHVLSRDGISMDKSKVEDINTFPRPKDEKQTRQFLGLSNWYRKFIKGYSEICAPLYKLLHKPDKKKGKNKHKTYVKKTKSEFKWDDKAEAAFQNLKSQLQKAPILAYPDFNKSFQLYTDSSTVSLGYMLCQKDENNKQRLISCGGRSLREHEKKYGITQLECLALVEAVKAHHVYLANQFFTVYTDHLSLKYLQEIKGENGRLCRWSLILQGYNFEICYKKGSSNTAADALSRRTYDENSTTKALIDDDTTYDLPVGYITGYGSHDKEWVELHINPPEQIGTNDTATMLPVNAIEIGENDQTMPISVDFEQRSDIGDMQRQCEDFADIIEYLENDTLPENDKRAKVVAYTSQQYIIWKGVLYHVYEPRRKGVPKSENCIRQLAVPKPLRKEVLMSAHDTKIGGAHAGFDRTYNTLKLSYFWPKMYADVEQYVASCEKCQVAKRPMHKHATPLKPLPVTSTFERWHMDILGPLTVSTAPGKYKYILLLVDSFSKWPEAFPLKTQEAREIADILYTHILTRYGSMGSILSDRGRNFMSKLVQALCELFEVKRHHTSPYHPQTNSVCERTNSTIGQALRALCNKNQQNWPDVLPGIMMSFRRQPANQSTGYSPYYMLFGKEMKTPTDINLLPKETLNKSTKEYVQELTHNLETANRLASENMKNAQLKHKAYHDKKAKEPNFKIGQSVWKYDPKVPKGTSSKLHRKWKGPYIITEVCPNHTYKLTNCNTQKELRSRINAAMLKPYNDPADRPEYLRDNENDTTDQNANRQNNVRQTNDIHEDIHSQNTQHDHNVQPDDSDNSQDDDTCNIDTVDKILRAATQNHKLIYHVRYNNGVRKWVNGHDVSEEQRQYFHENYTHQGKKKKKGRRGRQTLLKRR